MPGVREKRQGVLPETDTGFNDDKQQIDDSCNEHNVFVLCSGMRMMMVMMMFHNCEE